MVHPSAARPQNGLLRSLSPADFALLRGNLEPVTLPIRASMEESDKPIKFVYFPTEGIASVVAYGARKREIEVGIIGREGMSGVHVVLGSDRSPHATYMQVGGHGYRIAAAELCAAMQKSATLFRCFLHFVQTFTLQTAHTAIANGQGTLEERLARWLLMADDRVDGSELPLTH